MRLLIAVILSAITGIGGHYVNHRPRKALFFFGLILVWSVGVYMAMTLYASQIVGVADLAELEATVKQFWKLPTVGLVVIWVSSILVTYRDARPGARGYVEWRPAGVLQALVLSLLAGAVLVFQAWTLSQWVSLPQEMRGGSILEAGRPTSRMADAVMLGLGGRACRPLAEHEQLPVGPGVLAGQLLFEGKPFAGLTIQVAINHRFVVQAVNTDSEGRFEMKLPVGAWHVTGLGIVGWPAGIDPAGYVLLAGRGRGGVAGLRLLQVEDKPPLAPELFRIEPAVALSWPRPSRGVMAEGRADSVISWQPHGDARQYVVSIASRVEPGGESLPVVQLRVADATSLPLAQLHTFVAGEKSSDYLVTIQALGDDGRLLSCSTADWQLHGFFLAGGKKLAGELALTQDALSREERAELLAVERNQQRLQAVVALLRDGLVSEAGLLLQQVDGLTLPGHLEAVRGYYLASSGQCGRAAEMFTQAREMNESYELPTFYWGRCRAGESAAPAIAAP